MTGPETSLEGRWGLFHQFARDAEAAERLAALFRKNFEQFGDAQAGILEGGPRAA